MPLGWHISVYRQTNGGTSPAEYDAPRGKRVAVWQTGLGGLQWIDDLVERGNAIDLGGGGYPHEYTGRAQHLVPILAKGANRVWLLDPGDIVGPGWAGKTVIDKALVKACRSDEWLMVVAWDES